jgi:hypothetical protein
MATLLLAVGVCTENLIGMGEVTEPLKLAERRRPSRFSGGFSGGKKCSCRLLFKNVKIQYDNCSEWQDLNLRPPRPERGFHTQKSEIITGFGFRYTQVKIGQYRRSVTVLIRTRSGKLGHLPVQTPI